MTVSADRFYALLPAIYRIRDAEQGGPLRELLKVIEEQADIIEDDISRLYENWFIETCDDWVVPYIGDLLGYLPLRHTGEYPGTGPMRDMHRARILIPRRDVANTVRYRRRKGTLALLELLARDVAKWPARAVEFYRLLGWTQHLDHQHLLRGGKADLRDGKPLDDIDGSFDSIAHSVDIRRISSRRSQGRYNIPGVGLFACRLKSYRVTRTPAYCIDNASPFNYTFSVLGNDAPLFNRPVPEIDPRHIADETNLPVQIRRRTFEERRPAGEKMKFSQASEAYYGPQRSVAIWAPDWPKKGGGLIPADRIIPADLSDWKYQVPKNYVAVDPVLGRILFPIKQMPRKGVIVSYDYGFSDDIGGGEYPRQIPGPDIAAISRLRTGDILDPEGFAARLDTADAATDPVSTFIKESLSEETRQLLKTPESPGFCPALAGDLNRVLADGAFYDPARFENIEHPADEPAGISGDETDSIRVLRRNRLLLEAAYPGFIRTSYAEYRIGEGESFGNINAALIRWREDRPVHAVIEITDSKVYTEQISIGLDSNQSLYFRAADSRRPILRQLNWQTSLPDAISVSGGPGSRMIFDGLLVTGRGILISRPDSDEETGPPPEDICEVVVRHCTLVPGWSIDSESTPVNLNEPSIELMNTRSEVRIEKSIIGQIRVIADDIRAEPNSILIRNTILDATADDIDAVSAPGGLIAHAVLSIERCTVIGNVSTHAIGLAENSIFTGPVKVARSQTGCMRFCYVLPGSRTPRRFRCVPDILTAIDGTSDDEKRAIQMRVQPRFTDTRYGKPGYCQLGADCPEEIRCGAEDESEMGVFHDLYQPQREANLRLRLDEYTPAGMETGIIFVN